MRDFIRRIHPPTNNPYANLAVAVLFYAIKDLRQETEELIDWAFSRECNFWCLSAGIPQEEFCRRLMDELDNEEDQQSD